MTISAMTEIGAVDLKSDVSVRVARKSLDVAKQHGQAAVELLQSAANVAKGGSPEGVGERLDVLA